MFRTCMIMLMVLCLCVPAVAKDKVRVRKLRSDVIHELSVPEGNQSRVAGETCQLGNTDASWAITDWVYGEEEYSIYADPSECSDCEGGWQPYDVGMFLQFGAGDSLHFFFEVMLREVDLTSPGCPAPGAVISGPLTYEVTLPSVGLYLITAPLPGDAPVLTEPFFASWVFPNAFAEGGRPDLVTGAGPCTDCYSYNYWGSTWQDNCVDYGFPGDISLYTSVECQPLEPTFDIKPTSCPNPLNVKSNGVLPAAILGTEVFDVTEVDPASLLLAGIAPIRTHVADVSTPIGPGAELCECTELGPDGFLDLTMKFDTQDIVAAIQPVDDGDYVSLVLTGELRDGTPLEFDDCVWILDKRKPGIITALDAPSNDGPESKGRAEEKTWGTIKALYR